MKCQAKSIMLCVIVILYSYSHKLCLESLWNVDGRSDVLFCTTIMSQNGSKLASAWCFESFVIYPKRPKYSFTEITVQFCQNCVSAVWHLSGVQAVLVRHFKKSDCVNKTIMQMIKITWQMSDKTEIAARQSRKTCEMSDSLTNFNTNYVNYCFWMKITGWLICLLLHLWFCGMSLQNVLPTSNLLFYLKIPVVLCL